MDDAPYLSTAEHQRRDDIAEAVHGAALMAKSQLATAQACALTTPPDNPARDALDDYAEALEEAESKLWTALCSIEGGRYGKILP